MKYDPTDWNVYRTRFLVRARRLTEPLLFVDSLGREHQGDIGDYVVESSDGGCRIARQEIFEDIYVAMDPADTSQWPSLPDQPDLPHINEALPNDALRSPVRGVLRPAGSAFS
jgi:hypothetical protein